MKILTIDLEDWFHILDHSETESPQQWEKFESRVERNTDWILETLSKHNQRATFFCLGWIAKKHPQLIMRIVNQKHEIACHSMNHQLVHTQSRFEFENDLKDCISLLEDISSQKIKTYRAPGFSLTENTKWVFEILASSGIENDCSIFPLRRNHGGFENFRSEKACMLSIAGNRIREFPLNTAKLLGNRFVFSGGGYFRVLPYSVIKRLIVRSDYVMTYFHPRDFDSTQPVISSLPLRRKFMSYVGLKKGKKKFERVLKEFQFINVSQACEQIQWDNVPVISLD